MMLNRSFFPGAFSALAILFVILAPAFEVRAVEAERYVYEPRRKHSHSHQMVEHDTSNDGGGGNGGLGIFGDNRDGRSFWRDFLKPVLLRTTKNMNNEKNKNNRKEKKVEESVGEKQDTKSSTFGPPSPNSLVEENDPALATKNPVTTTTTEKVPTAIPISDDYELKLQQQIHNQQNTRPPYGGHGGVSQGPAGFDPFAVHPVPAGPQQSSPFVFSIPPGGGSPVPGAPAGLHQLHRPPFGRPQSAYQQYLLKQYGSAFDPPKQQSTAVLSSGTIAAGNNVLNDPRLLMLLLQMRQRELTQGTDLTNLSSASSAELKAEERALLDLLNSLGDRTGLSSFTNFDRINWDFLNPFRNRFTLPLLNFLSGQNRPYMAVATVHDNGAPGAPPSVASGTLTFYQKNAAAPIQVEVDLEGIGSNARNVRIDVRNNIPLANCGGQGDVFNPTGRTSGGIILTIGSSDPSGRMAAVISNLPREAVSLAAPNSIVGKSVQISEAGVIHGCGTILAANALPASPLNNIGFNGLGRVIPRRLLRSFE